MKITRNQHVYLEQNIYRLVREVHSRYGERFFPNWWNYYEKQMELNLRFLERPVPSSLKDGSEFYQLFIVPKSNHGVVNTDTFFDTFGPTSPLDWWTNSVSKMLYDVLNDINDYDTLRDYFKKTNLGVTKSPPSCICYSVPVIRMVNGIPVFLKQSNVTKTTLTIDKDEFEGRFVASLLYNGWNHSPTMKKFVSTLRQEIVSNEIKKNIQNN